MANIADVARLAGVSVTTVSNVINNKPNISTEVYQRVLQTMDALDYHPSLLARNLKSNKTRFVGVLLPSLQGHYVRFLEGISNHLQFKGYNVLLKLTGDFPAQERILTSELIDTGVKGLIVVSSCLEEEQPIDYKNLPHVFLERYSSRFDSSYVRFDNENAAYETTCRLLNTIPAADGCITLVRGSGKHLSELDCEKGFLDALSGKPYEVLEVSANPVRAFGELTEYFTRCTTPPLGFVVTSDATADCLAEVQALYGTHIPARALTGDVWNRIESDRRGLIGARPAVSCGAAAAKLLIRWMNSPLLFESEQLTLTQNHTIVSPSCETEPVSDGGELSVLLASCPATDALKKLIPIFERHEGIRVHVRECTQGELYHRIADIGPGNDVDACMLDNPWLDSMLGQLLPLDELLNNDTSEDCIGSMLETARTQLVDGRGNIFALPMMISGQMLFYRKDLFESSELRRAYYAASGIELKAPSTWSEFNIIARFFTRAFNPDSPTRFGTCILGQIPSGIIQEYLPRQWSCKGSFIPRVGNRSIPAVDTVSNIKALGMLCDAYRCSAPESLGYMEDEQIRDFINGDIALISTFSSHVLSMFDTRFENFMQNVGFCQLPGQYSILGGWLLGIPRESKHSSNAYRFIKWACGERMSIYSTLLGGLVPQRLVADSKAISQTYPWLGNMAENLSTARRQETVPGIAQNVFTNELAACLLEAVSGTTSPEDAMRKLQSKLARLI